MSEKLGHGEIWGNCVVWVGESSAIVGKHRELGSSNDQRGREKPERK